MLSAEFSLSAWKRKHSQLCSVKSRRVLSADVHTWSFRENPAFHPEFLRFLLRKSVFYDQWSDPNSNPSSPESRVAGFRVLNFDPERKKTRSNPVFDPTWKSSNPSKPGSPGLYGSPSPFRANPDPDPRVPPVEQVVALVSTVVTTTEAYQVTRRWNPIWVNTVLVFQMSGPEVLPVSGRIRPCHPIIKSGPNLGKTARIIPERLAL